MLVYKKECTNMEEKIVTILNEMAEYLTVPQMKKITGSNFKNIFRERT